MYRKEQFQAAMKQAAAQQKIYTEDSIDQARAKWHDTHDLVLRIQSGERSVYTIHEARQAEDDAKRELDDALLHAAPLAAAKRARELAASREKERHTEQVQHTANEKSKFRAEAKARWVVAGGSEHAFAENFESLWTEEVKRRVQGPSEQEALQQRLIQSGRYSF